MSARMAPAFGNVESSEGRIHRGLPEILASPQEFRVDRADLLEYAAQLAGVVDQLGNLQMHGIGDVISSGPSAGLADAQIILRAMSGSVDAMAVRPPAALEGLDQCAAQDVLDRRQVAHQSATASAQGG